MNINLTFKPQIFTATTKDQLLNKIKYSVGGRQCIGSKGTCIMNKSGDTIVYNLQKTRAKFQRTDKAKKIKGVDHPVKQSIKLKSGGWTAYVYVFKKDLPIVVQQNTRNFTFNVDKHKLSMYN